MGVFILVLGVIYSRLFHTELETYLPYLTVGFVVWGFMSASANDSCIAFIEGSRIIKQIKLPYSVYVLRVVWRNFIIFLHTICSSSGHEKGSFTGAASRHIGKPSKFEQAEGGTLFLDEIGDMPLAMQAKLLRVLEEGEVERVGGDKPIKVNVRVIVATHRNLEDLVKKNEFRADLFHRVFVFPLTLPPLRERKEDFPALVAHFARQVAKQNGWREKLFSEDAVAEFRRYPWPGNVRELRNIVERLVLLSTEETVSDDDVRQALPTAELTVSSASAIDAATGQGTLEQRTEAFEREVLLAEIRRHNFHMTNVARALGLERSHLYKKCQQLGIDLHSLRNPE